VEGMPRGINAALLDVVGPVMAKAREAFHAGGREGMSGFSFSIPKMCSGFIPCILVVRFLKGHIIRVGMVWQEPGLEAPEGVLILSMFYLFSVLVSRRSQKRK
jgi:hypothetical protein